LTGNLANILLVVGNPIARTADYTRPRFQQFGRAVRRSVNPR
jgi:hypothetical protein